MLTIKTNHVPREIIYGFSLTEQERKEFDYLEGSALDEQAFFRFKGQVYDLSQFMHVEPQMLPEFQSWHGYSSDSAFSGLVIHYSPDFETVIVGTYYS